MVFLDMPPSMRSVRAVQWLVGLSLACGNGAPVHPSDNEAMVAAPAIEPPAACMAPPPGAAPSQFRFELESIFRSLGRDASTTRTHGAFDGAQLTLTGPTAPCVRTRCETATVSFFPSLSERAELQSLLDADVLQVGTVYEEADELPHAYASTSLRFELSRDGQTTTSLLQYSQARERPEPIPARAQALDEAVHGLVSLMRRHVLRCHPTFRVDG